MSHFAKVVAGKVVEVIVAEPEFFISYKEDVPGLWLQTSYNTYGNQHPDGRPLRGNFAGIGFTYDSKNDVFYAPQPFPSWTLNQNTWLWEAPIPYPGDGKTYNWNETNKTWEEVI